MSYWSFISRTAGAAASAGKSLTNGMNSFVRSQTVKPRRRSMRRGILVPGDGPPVGAANTFLDYRRVLLPAQVTALQQGVFPLGRIQDPGHDVPGFPIFLDWEHVARHVAVVGPSRSGKTYNILAPWIAAATTQGVTTVAVDVKGDLLSEISSARTRMDITDPIRYYLWDVSNPQASRSWNPLSEVATPLDASQVAIAFLGEVDPDDHQKFFAERDHRWLRGLVWLTVQAMGASTHPSVLYKLVISQQWLAQVVRQVPQAAHEVIDLVQYSQPDFAKVTAGLSNKLSWLADPSLATMLSGVGARSFTLAQAFDSGAIVVVGCRTSGGERDATAASVFLNLARQKCLERFGRNAVPVFWILDEARSYAQRIQLPQMLDLLAGARSPVCVGLQDVNQLGDEKQQIRMLANCDTFIALKGVSADTATFLSDRLGHTSAPSTTMTMDQSGKWRPSLTHQDRPLLGDREIMAPPVGRYGGVAHIKSAQPERPGADFTPVFLFSFD